jgi:hypothetical protein
MGETATPFALAGLTAVAGAASGGLIGAWEAAASGTAHPFILAEYLSATGVVGGALLGVGLGYMSWLNPPGERESPQRWSRRRLWVIATLGLFLPGLVPLTTWFFTSFHNHLLAAGALLVLAVFLWAVAAFFGAAMVGITEMLLGRLWPVRARACATRLANLGPGLLGAGLAMLLWTHRHSFPPGDAEGIIQGALWVLVTWKSGRSMARSGVGKRLSSGVVVTATAVAFLGCSYATALILTGRTPEAVAASRPHLGLFRSVVRRGHEVGR